MPTFKEGQPVHYQPAHYREDDKWENGIVKKIHDNFDIEGRIGYQCVFVVYNCAENWSRYKDYTAALTNIGDLKPGWRF